MKFFHFRAEKEIDSHDLKPENVLLSNDSAFEMTGRRWGGLYSTVLMTLMAGVVVLFARSAYLDLTLERVVTVAVLLALLGLLYFLSRRVIVYAKCERGSIVIRRKSKRSGESGDIFMVDASKLITVFTNSYKNRTSIELAFTSVDGKNTHFSFRDEEFGKPALAWLERWLRKNLKATIPS